MHLRSLTIRGFKSFADKSVLRLESGITYVVGPNGSGKSNFTDAVLWVLGEQSARTLRGSSMVDVIFAGSAGKKALGTAEVSITLDNTDGRIPIDFSEVVIARRLFRSGESEYMINRVPCRLIDIHELLSDTGLGREMYSVISQGRLDDILNSKPGDRRQLLEEAAGVLKYKKRKERALRKLLSMETNLSRGKDILREVTRQLTPLKRQADQASRHAELAKELKDIQVRGAVGKLKRLQKRWEESCEELAAKKDFADKLKYDFETARAVVADLESELENKGILAGDIGEYRRRLEGLLERVNSGLLLLEEKGKNLIAKLSEFRQAIHRFESGIKNRTDELDRLNDERRALESKLAGYYQGLREARRVAETIKKESRSALEEEDKAAAELESEKETVTKTNSEIDQLSSAIGAAAEKIIWLRKQQAMSAERRTACNDEKKTIAADRDRLAIETSRLKKEQSEIRTQIAKAIESKSNLEELIEHCSRDYREAQAMLAAVTAIGKKTQEDFSWLEKHREHLPNLGERLTDMVQVSAKYEKAVEAVLGLNINAVTAKDLMTAAQAYRYIKDATEHPVRLVPLVGKSASKATVIAGLTPAVEVVDCREHVCGVIERLLADVWITENLSAFLESKTAAPETGVVVDLSGDFIDNRGLIARQTVANDTQGALTIRRERKDLQKRESELSIRLGAVKGELANIILELEQKRQADLAMTTEIQKIDGRMINLVLRAQGLDKEIAGFVEHEAEICAQIREKQAEIDRDETNLELLRKRLKEVEATLETLDVVVKEKDKLLTAKRLAEREVAGRLSEARIALASLTEKQTHIKSRLVSVEDDLEQAQKAFAEQRKAIDITEELRLRIQPVHDLYTDLRLRAEEWAEKLEEAAGAELENAAVMRDELRRQHRSLGDISTDLDRTNEALRIAEIAKTQAETEVSQITKHLVDDLDTALETVLAVDDRDISLEERQLKEDRIRQELARLGPVNQIAATEFAGLEKRRQFLARQIDDLVRGQKALRKVVDAIDGKIKARFKTTFDEVNRHFADVFSQLFPGGTARLVLTEDEYGSGEAGVEIEAQPRGKNLQGLSLLSGGERSLVGLALLFALYHTRPSPFYILDEVEAALDDVNLRRFITLLRKLKSETQFMIITHQRRTMEIADCVYGVSMQADGISKIISQKLAPGETTNGEDKTELAATAVGRPDQIQKQS